MADQCKSFPLGGGQCELDAGHEGKHQRTSFPYGPEGKPFVFDWTDEGQRRLVNEHTSRFD